MPKHGQTLQPRKRPRSGTGHDLARKRLKDPPQNGSNSASAEKKRQSSAECLAIPGSSTDINAKVVPTNSVLPVEALSTILIY